MGRKPFAPRLNFRKSWTFLSWRVGTYLSATPSARVQTLFQSPSDLWECSTALKYSFGVSWCLAQCSKVEGLSLLKAIWVSECQWRLELLLFTSFLKDWEISTFFILISTNIVITRKGRIVRLWNEALKNCKVSWLRVTWWFDWILLHMFTDERVTSNVFYKQVWVQLYLRWQSIQYKILCPSFPQCHRTLNSHHNSSTCCVL